MTTMRRFTAICLFVSAAGCGGLDESEEEVFRASEQAITNGDWDAALAGADVILGVHPDFLPASLVKGRALFELGRYPESRVALRAVIEGERNDTTMLFTARLHTGRSFIEETRARFTDAMLLSGKLDLEQRKAARNSCLEANLHFDEALKLEPDDYSANLWRGYATLRLENFRKALEYLERCRDTSSHRWEHRFFSALALEGMYQLTKQSLEQYLAIARDAPTADMAPVYEHLVAVYPRTSLSVQENLRERLDHFARQFPGISPLVDEFSAEMRARENLRRQQDRLAEVSREVRELLSQDQLSHVHLLIRRHLQEVGDRSAIADSLATAREEWSKLLESRADSLNVTDDRQGLKLVLESFELARDLTKEVDRLVVLQQKINALQITLARHQTSRRIQEAYELLTEKQYDRVLRNLADVNVQKLSEEDQDLYYYLEGASHFQLGRWTAATDSFRRITSRDFENLNAYHGLALLRSGQQSAGVALLVGIPGEDRDDEINRLLGNYFLERQDLHRAVEYLAAIEKPTPKDSEARCESRRLLGREYFVHGDFRKAAEEFQAACQILETELRGRRPELYLELGTTYFRLDERERSKKVYHDLSNSGLTRAERRRCRDLYVNRGRIHLQEKHPELAYQDFTEFLSLGGRLDDELDTTYGRLVATYGNYMPLETVRYWNYVSTGTDYNYTLHVAKKGTGAYQVLRREAGNTASEETWWRQGIYLTKEVGDAVFKIPVNLHPAEATLPVIEYKSRGMDCVSEIVEINQVVRLPGKTNFDHCLKIRAQQRTRRSDGSIRVTKHLIYLAPGVGQVKEEIFRDDVKVSEIVLSGHRTREDVLGN